MTLHGGWPGVFKRFMIGCWILRELFWGVLKGGTGEIGRKGSVATISIGLSSTSIDVFYFSLAYILSVKFPRNRPLVLFDFAAGNPGVLCESLD